jgi:RNA polymerase sigma factor (TIGR02999 family)
MTTSSRVGGMRQRSALTLTTVPDTAVKSGFHQIDSTMYERLRCLAVFHMRRERRAHGFDPTDLISEVYLRLAGTHLDLADQGHFLAIVSRTMRRFLVDYARKRLAAKRPPDDYAVEFDEARLATDRSRELITLADTLEELMQYNKRKARVTALCYFGGLTHKQIATMCGLHANTVSRDLRESQEWLRCHFHSENARSAR